MSITLQKPLGSDVYNVGVFNENATEIEEVLNPLIENVNTILEELPNKYYFKILQSTDTINTTLSNGIYYLPTKTVGTLPTGAATVNNIIISIQGISANSSTQYLLTSDGQIFKRNTTGATMYSWTQMSAKVVDNLESTENSAALSANQGRILDKLKFNIIYLSTGESIDFDAIDKSGIYVCDGVSVSASELPSSLDFTTPEYNHFVFTHKGNITNHTVIEQNLTTDKNQQFVRTGVYDESIGYNWSEWLAVGSGGGSGSDITLSIVEE